MKFTYSADVHCGCGQMVAGWSAAGPAEAERSALTEATAHGWLQIGDQVWCSKCAQARPHVEALKAVRQGRFVPVKGMRLRYAFSKCKTAIPNGHLLAPLEKGFVEGELYTVEDTHVADTWAMVSFSEKSGFFNLELFEEVKG